MERSKADIIVACGLPMPTTPPGSRLEPDELKHEELAAELTNHFIPRLTLGALLMLVPPMVGIAGPGQRSDD
jgi:hypothetical protein